MRVPLVLALTAAVLAACKVEPTPRSFYNHRNPAVVEVQESEGEIRTRIMGLVAALNRGDTAAAREAVNPADLVQVMGPTAEDSLARFGSAGLSAALSQLRRPGESVARTPDLRVSAGEAMAWFATHVEVLPVAVSGTRIERLRLSGVFVRDRGEWRLVQLHLAQGGAARADSAAADSVSPAAARPSQEPGGAPAEDG